MENYLKCNDGVKLYYRKDIPESPVATIVINHGFAEHLNRYDYVTKVLNMAKLGVYRYDLRGHGRTKSERGYINNFMEFVSDADEVVNLAKKEYPDLPLFMLGHSMGGFITCLYGLAKPNKLHGQIFSGAAVKRLPVADGIKGDLFKLVNLFVPRLKVKNMISEDICSVKEVVDDYKNDPLVLKDAALNFYVQFVVKGADWIEKNIKSYNYPCLITHGEKDKIVPKEASIYLYRRISSSDKEIKIYDDLYHEIFNENEKDKVLSDIINWLYERTK